MAQQATVKRAQTAPKPVNTGGRPANSRAKKPGEPVVFDYSVESYDLTFQKNEDFYRYLAGYPDKTGLLAYIYRIRPKIDLSLIGQDETAILKTEKEDQMTAQFVGEEFGRGYYMCCLNDANRPKGRKELCKTFFDCGTVPKPPQYDPRTLCLAEPKNQDEIQRLLNSGILVRDRVTGQARVRTAEDGTPPPPAAPAPTVSQAAPFGNELVGQIVLAAMKGIGQSPHDVVRDTIDMAKLITPPPQPAVDVEAVVERVVSRVMKGSRSVDPIDELERLQTWAGRVRGLLGLPSDAAPVAANGEAGSSWAPHLAGIFSEFRQTLPELIAGVRALRAEYSAAPQNPTNGGNAALPLTIEQRIEQVCIMGFQRMKEGVQGFDFAAYICAFHPGGLEVYRELEQVGTVGVIALAAMRPATRAVVNDPKIRPQLEAFLNDFFSYDPDGGGGAAGADESPAPASAA